MTSLFLITIGILIGWNLPQPIWAKVLQDKAVTALKEKGLVK
jgi:hypothetical protein